MECCLVLTESPPGLLEIQILRLLRILPRVLFAIEDSLDEAGSSRNLIQRAKHELSGIQLYQNSWNSLESRSSD